MSQPVTGLVRSVPRSPGRSARIDHLSTGRTVLIVDDRQGLRATARLMLGIEGRRVVGEADRATAALSAAQDLRPGRRPARREPPDGDGFDVAARLRQDTSPPAVVMTSSRDDLCYSGLASGSGTRGFIPMSQLSPGPIDALVG